MSTLIPPTFFLLLGLAILQTLGCRSLAQPEDAFVVIVNATGTDKLEVSCAGAGLPTTEIPADGNTAGLVARAGRHDLDARLPDMSALRTHISLTAGNTHQLVFFLTSSPTSSTGPTLQMLDVPMVAGTDPRAKSARIINLTGRTLHVQWGGKAKPMTTELDARAIHPLGAIQDLARLEVMWATDENPGSAKPAFLDERRMEFEDPTDVLVLARTKGGNRLHLFVIREMKFRKPDFGNDPGK